MIIPDKFYQKIIEAMPLPCVDLLIPDKKGKEPPKQRIFTNIKLARP
jgi:hypothetical protein